METIEKCKEKETRNYFKYFFVKYVVNVIPAKIPKISNHLSE